MQAILLAAGVGRRLASLDEKTPKCLLRFDGVTLLHRHMSHLETCGVEKLIIVVGHKNEMVEAEAVAYAGHLDVQFAYNARYREGSILSLQVGLKAADPNRSALVMDADVLYHVEVLRRLVEAPFDNGFLLDPRTTAHGEEMMLGVKDGRVMSISRQIGNGHWDLMGEGVGFFKLHCADQPVLEEQIEAKLAEGRSDADYESAIDAFLDLRPAHYVSVADLPWTEIDFDEDVEHAETRVLPAIKARTRHRALAAAL